MWRGYNVRLNLRSPPACIFHRGEFPSARIQASLHWCVPTTRNVFRCLSAAGAALLAISTPSISQQAEPASALAEAGQLRDSGRFVEAIEVLRRHRALHPDDGDAIRMLAQTLYWVKDMRAARALYDSGLVLHPVDTALRIQYGRMLMETGDPAQSKSILDPLVTGSPPNPQALELLGTIAYWQGDLTSARRSFEQAIVGDTSLVDARRQLNEIRALTATWIRTTAHGSTDDQPVKGAGAEIEAGYYINPLWALVARARSLFLSEDASTSPSASSTNLNVFSGSIGVAGSVPSSSVSISVDGGLFSRSNPSKLDWTAKGTLGAKLGSFARAGVRAERAPYLYTEASLRTHVMTNSIGAELDVDRRGWIGKAAFDVLRYPDDNSTSTAYAWAMAPLVRTAGATLQAGYSASYQNALQLRFVRNSVDSGGHYDPYYTPQNLFVNSVIGAFTASGANGLVARLGGSYGFHAREDAPTFAIAPSGSMVLGSFNRSFHPWSARASLEKTMTPRSVLSAHIDHSKTAFYHVTNAVIELTWRLAPR